MMVLLVSDVQRTDVARVEAKEPVTKLIGKLRTEKKNIAFVFDQKRFLGVVPIAHLLRSRMHTPEEKVERLLWNVPLLTPEQTLVEAAAALFNSNVQGLPVWNGTAVQGVAYASDVIAHLDAFPELKGKTVADIRHPLAITINEHERLSKVLEIMRREGIEHLPVVDDNGILRGMLSDVDIMEKYLSQPVVQDAGWHKSKTHTKGNIGERPTLLDMPVRSFEMREEAITCTRDAPLAAVGHLIKDHQVSSVVVEEKRKPVFIITKRDLLEALAGIGRQEYRNIQYVGLRQLGNLSPYMLNYVQKLCSYYAEKILIMLNNVNTITIHFKEYAKAGKSDKQHKYAVHVKVAAPLRLTFVSTKAADWDLPRTVHKAFKDVESQIIHRLRVDNKRPKAYG